MCEQGCGYGHEHGHIEHGHIPHHEFPHGVHGYPEYHGYRHHLTKEEELKVLEDWKKKLQNKLARMEQRIGELKESGEG
jgi:hypothetical protein